MNAGDLKKLLADVPDDTPVIGRENDHTYYPVWITLATALREGPGQWGEDFGEDLTPEDKFGERVPVLIVE